MLWVIIVAVLVIVGLLAYSFPLVQVCGDSMYPTFKDGDIVLGSRLFKLKRKAIYVYTPPVGEKYVIKRLTQVSPTTHKLFFEGDNANYSYDSRMYGYISRDKVVARYIFTIYRKKGV